ncbi:putative reverse transcriptase domain-containing protein [Tanacetum coccineum]
MLSFLSFKSHEFITSYSQSIQSTPQYSYNVKHFLTNRGTLASLEYSQETEGPYCTDLPTPDDCRRLLELERVVVDHGELLNGELLNGELLNSELPNSDEIYSTVDACNTANEMKKASRKLQQGESLNYIDGKEPICFWEFGSLLLEMENPWSRITHLATRNGSEFVTAFSKEVNDIRAERIAKSANPLALLAAAQPYSDTYYQAPKPQRSNATSSSTRQSASTRHKGKEVAKPITPQSESVSEEEDKILTSSRTMKCTKLALLCKVYQESSTNLPTTTFQTFLNLQETRLKYHTSYTQCNQSRAVWDQRTNNFAGARETVGSQVVQQTGIQCFNCKGYGHYAKECRKPKRVKDYAYHKEKMMMCKQAKRCSSASEQSRLLEDTDEEMMNRN